MMRRLSAVLGVTALCFGVSVASSVLRAQPQVEPIWPGAKYDPAIPTIQQVLGHDTGMEITPPDQVGDYLQALAKAAPARTRLIEYARTWENRPLWLMVIGSPERIVKLDEVKRDLQRLADPRGLSQADADRLVKQVPVVTWLIHGVHGNEISSSDAALFEAYHLLASQGDADIDLVLRESLVLIDPMQNPDGRARFVFQNLQSRASVPDPTPYNAEHDEPWPGGRSNHYLFDMNRDWFAQTQPETRGRITIGREYFPHVTVDLHEQGGDNSYYFAPPADPVNPHITESQRRAWDLFGRANGARFDQRGWAYFIAEVYDAFYPGYGDSWPTFNGSIGMTYEQASARALSFARDDDTVMTYRDGVTHHANAAITTAVTAARNRERLVREFLEYRRSAIAEGEKSTKREYLLVPGQDPSRAALLARNLATQGIEVRRADEAFTVAKREFPAGTFLVSHAQPTGRLIRNLLDPQTDQPADFIKRQEERRAKRLNDEIYDVTAWNLPMLYDVDLATSAAAVNVRSTNLPMADGASTSSGSRQEEPKGDAVPPVRSFPPSSVAYVMPWGSAAAAVAVEALQQGIRMHSVGGAFTLNGRAFPLGTAVIRAAGNPADLHSRLTTLATKHGAEIVPTNTTYIESGTSLGSNDTAYLKAPRVLLAWDAPTASLSAGWTRYTLERRFGQPVTIVRVSSLARANLADFDVIVLPSGNYGTSINEAMLNRMKDWLRAGGTLVTLAEATRWATGSNVGLLSTTGLLKDGRPDTSTPSAPGAQGAAGAGGSGNASPGKPAEFDYDKAIQPERERPASQPGAILRVLLETDHWLSAGHDGELFSMIEGNRVFAPIKLDNGRNVGRWATKDRLIASGLIWPEAQDILVQKPYLMHQPFGQGHVVAFAEDANYRAYSEGPMLLFMNAVLLGPGF
jgi:hypothetical protein